jgi:hypothetical protein
MVIDGKTKPDVGMEEIASSNMKSELKRQREGEYVQKLVLRR